MARADSVFRSSKFIATCRRNKVRFSVTIPVTDKVRAAIATFGLSQLCRCSQWGARVAGDEDPHAVAGTVDVVDHPTAVVHLACCPGRLDNDLVLARRVTPAA